MKPSKDRFYIPSFMEKSESKQLVKSQTWKGPLVLAGLKYITLRP